MDPGSEVSQVSKRGKEKGTNHNDRNISPSSYRGSSDTATFAHIAKRCLDQSNQVTSQQSQDEAPEARKTNQASLLKQSSRVGLVEQFVTPEGRFGQSDRCSKADFNCSPN